MITKAECTNQKLVDDFISIYQILDKSSLAQLSSVYHPDIRFIDPIHQIKGLDNLIHYFEGMYQNTQSCQFNIQQVSHAQADQVFLNWVMQLSHKKIAHGKPIQVNGLSQLKIEQDKIVYHRDYFDLTEMIFDHLPLVGSITRYVKQKAVNS